MSPSASWAAATALAGSPAVFASTMSYEQLETCAGYVQRMRAESPALVAEDRGNAELRQYYNAGNGTHGDKLAFNRRMDRYRQDVIALNRVRQAFAGQCAGRAVRLRDVEQLPEPARSAWRRGLDDIEVPYLGPSDGGATP